MKLLFFLDFFHFRETGASVTGLEYYAWDFGPYPVEFGNKISDNDPEVTSFLRIVKSEGNIKLIPKKSFNDKYLTKRELRLLEEISFIFKNAKAYEITEISHLKNTPWDRTIKEKGDRAKIDYWLALEEHSPSMADIMENVRDRKIIERAFE